MTVPISNSIFNKNNDAIYITDDQGFLKGYEIE